MIAFIARRFAQSVVILLGVTLLTFVLLHLIPGGPARGILGPRATAPQIAAFEQENDLNKPVFEQFLLYLDHLLRGNFGYSYKLNQTVGSRSSRRICPRAWPWSGRDIPGPGHRRAARHLAVPAPRQAG